MVRTRSARLKKPSATSGSAVGVVTTRPRKPKSRTTSSGTPSISHYSSPTKMFARATRESRQSTTSPAVSTRRSARTASSTSIPVSSPHHSTPSSSRTTATFSLSSASTSSLRSRRTTTSSIGVVPQPKALRSPTNTSRTPLKRDSEIFEDRPSRVRKRQRAVSKDDEVKSLARRLKEAEKGLRHRELELKKREAAVVKKQNALLRKEQSLLREHEGLRGRKETLLAKMRDVAAQSKDLVARGKAISAQEKALAKQAQREAAAAMIIPSSGNHDVNPIWALSYLEEHFTCSLCYEVMACPYSLNPGRCGHSFCALCILKWCFAAVHRGCGYWHDSLECPLCRAELPYTPDMTPRHMFTFPFTPNRLADAAIKALIETVKSAKPEAGTGVCTGGNEPKAGATVAQCDAHRLLAWRDNGMSYDDWSMRDERGRSEMTILVNEWPTLQANDFVAFKDRLSV
ncbi:hypothetical protein BD414DRAFT_63823 [Trametes punicea]|nr:hypothetical protein BD414DRAFT_63823 [Trametes punicea]